jgi:hypothetical protein
VDFSLPIGPSAVGTAVSFGVSFRALHNLAMCHFLTFDT